MITVETRLAMPGEKRGGGYSFVEISELDELPPPAYAPPPPPPVDIT